MTHISLSDIKNFAACNERKNLTLPSWTSLILHFPVNSLFSPRQLELIAGSFSTLHLPAEVYHHIIY